MRLIGRWQRFWIDAICTDQSNVLEWNRQVGMMRQIYAQAILVTVWLGGASPSSGLIIGYITEKIYDCRASIKEDCHSQHRAVVGIALRGLLEHPYWTQIWIVQELMLARDAIFF